MYYKNEVCVCWSECHTRPYLRSENLALRGRSVGVRGDGGASVDVVRVDVVADATADGAAVVPAGHTQTHTEKEVDFNAVETVNLRPALNWLFAVSS